VPPIEGGTNMPIYTDKRTGKKVIQYQIGYRHVPDPQSPGKLIKRPKYKTEVIGKSARVARKILSKRETDWERKRCSEEFGSEPLKTHYTFAELMAWYLELPTAKKKRSYKSDVEKSKPLLEYFGNMAADKIKPSMVESFQDKMLKMKDRFGSNYKPATVNRMIALMKRVFNLAIREDMALKNPCWKVSMLKEDNKRDRILSPEEFDRLFGVFPDYLKPIVSLGYYTGMRRGEILRLTWKKVNIQEGFIDLDPKDTKNSEPRRIYFNDVLRDIFKKAGKVRSLKHDYVFTYRGKPLKGFREGFNRALKRAGIENFHFHDLRHTFNTNMRKAGVDQTVIMKLTGHKTFSMFNRYNTVDQEDAVNAMKRLDLFLSEQKSSESSDIVQTATGNQKIKGSKEPFNSLK
jgi:integrase